MRMYCISVCCVFLSLCLVSATEPSGDLGHPLEEEAFLPEEESPLRWREEIADHFQFPRIQKKIDLALTGRLDLNGDGRMEQLVQGRGGSGGPSWQLLDSLADPLIFPTGWQYGYLYLAQKNASGWHDLVATSSLGCNTTIFTLYRYDTELHLYFILREEIHYHDKKKGVLMGSAYARDDWDFWHEEDRKIQMTGTGLSPSPEASR